MKIPFALRPRIPLPRFAYDYQTFSVGQVLTAAQMQQVEDNVRDHAHGSDGVSDIAASELASDISTLVLIGEQSASASAALDFTDIVGATYPIHELHCLNLVPTTVGSTLILRMDSDNGASFDAGASDYRYAVQGWKDSGASSNSNSTGATSIQLTPASTTGIGLNAIITIYGLGLSGTHKGIHWLAHHFDGTNYAVRSGMGVSNNTDLLNNPVNALRILASAGTIASGTVRLYGRKA